jgi:hypothetical protein
MFFRHKRSGHTEYLQIVKNERVDGKPRQAVVATLGRVDELAQDGPLDRLLRSGARFAHSAVVLTAYERRGHKGSNPPARAGARFRTVVAGYPGFGRGAPQWFRGPPPQPASGARARSPRYRPLPARSKSGVVSASPHKNLLVLVHAFSSRLTSFRKRQSVPSAIIFCGLVPSCVN